MKIGITGDMHGDAYYTQVYQARKIGFDTLIVCGDFGHVWNPNLNPKQDKQLDYMNDIGIKVLFVAGNHECYPELAKYPVTKMFGAKVQVIRDNIIHLMRGQVYNIDGNKIFTFGGAKSQDRQYRTLNKDWWNEEVPTRAEMSLGLRNLIQSSDNPNDIEVDYIITHDIFPCAANELLGYEGEFIGFNYWLNGIRQITDYKTWYFGHYHKNQYIDEYKCQCLYKEVIELGEHTNGS